MDRNVWMWYGHVDRMKEERAVKRGYRSKVEGSRGKGRPKLWWMDVIKAVVERRGANIEYARMCMQDLERWSSAVHSNHVWSA
jgi:hypothetical protein